MFTAQAYSLPSNLDKILIGSNQTYFNALLLLYMTHCLLDTSFFFDHFSRGQSFLPPTCLTVKEMNFTITFSFSSFNVQEFNVFSFFCYLSWVPFKQLILDYFSTLLDPLADQLLTHFSRLCLLLKLESKRKTLEDEKIKSKKFLERKRKKTDEKIKS